MEMPTTFNKPVLAMIQHWFTKNIIPTILIVVDEDDCNWRCLEGGKYNPELSHEWNVISWEYVEQIKSLQTENQNLKAAVKIAVQAGESLQKELEAVKGENKKLFSLLKRLNWWEALLRKGESPDGGGSPWESLDNLELEVDELLKGGKL